MEEVVGGSGKIKMKYNYLTAQHVLFRINEELSYDKIVRIKATKGCGCQGNVNTFYIVNGSKIPTNRAILINT